MESAARCIAHVDMDAFYVSVELQRRPELRGLPVVVAGSGARAVVTTASYEARRFGVGSAIPAARARRLCPEAIFVSPDFTAYRAKSREVMEIVRRQVEAVEVVGLDEAYLDLTGLSSPRAAMRRMIAQIRQDTGLGCSIGIGPNKLVAKVASDAEKPAGFVVLGQDEARRRFAGAPPGLVPGIGPKTAAKLAALGIIDLAALAAAPEAMLVKRFGSRLGPYLGRRARFEDLSPVSSHRIAVSESRETTFPHDLSDRGEQAAALARLSTELCGALRRQERRARTIGIKVRLDDFSTHTRSRTLAAAINEPAQVGAIAQELLHDFAAPRPVRLLGVRAAGFDSTPATAADQLALPLQ
jgi:DNA polymerase-4